MTKPDNLVHSDYMTNLGTDHLAVAANGHVVGRASTNEAIRQAVPDAAHYLTAKDLAPAAQQAKTGTPETDADPRNPNVAEPNPVSAGLDAVVAQQAPVKDDDAKADKDLDAKAKTHPQPTAKTPEHKVPTAKTPDHKHATGAKK